MLKAFVLDVLFQRWLLKKDFLRWAAHICIYGGFMGLLVMHGLDGPVTSAVFDDYHPTLNPFMFLRNLFGIIVIAGLGLAARRRILSRAGRIRTTAVDYYAIIALLVIVVSGFLLEASKIISYSKYQEMAEEYSDLEDEEETMALEAFWVTKFAVVSPALRGPFDADVLRRGEELHEINCAGCHSRAGWAFAAFGAAALLKPAALSLDRLNVRALLRHMHFLSCLLGLALIPFTKFFHILATPVYLLVRAMGESDTADPANIATKRAIELDACTHCGDCSASCSVAVAFQGIPNPSILPSEKLAAFGEILSGRGLSEKRLTAIQEGSYICTDCHRCTDACPVGINLEALWLSLERHLAGRGRPKPEVWARDAISTRFDMRSFDDESLLLTPAEKAFANELACSVQAKTFSVCFGCRNCTNVCPVVGSYEDPKQRVGLLPHEIMHCLALKQRSLAIAPRMLWDCVTCYMCQEYCPQGVRVTDVLYQLKNLALKSVKEGGV